MSRRKDSAMESKIRKVKKYDIEARRERIAMDIIQDARQRARRSKPRARFELVYVSGRIERFVTYEEMVARRLSRSSSVIYTRDLRPRAYDAAPIEREYYVVKLKCGRYVVHYFEDDARARFAQDDAESLRFFPSLEIITK